MKKYRIAVLSNDCDWIIFCPGFFDSLEAATEQKAIFMQRYPKRIFTIC